MFFHSQIAIVISAIILSYMVTSISGFNEGDTKPTLQDAQFDASHQELDVIFSPLFTDSPDFSYYSSCGNIFTDPFLYYLGSMSVCYATSRSHVKVHLINATNITIGTSVDINPTHLDGNDSVVVNTTFPLDVKIKLTEPFTKTYCLNNPEESYGYISADLSYNYGYQPIKLLNDSWNITNGGGNIEVIDQLFIKYKAALINGSTVLNDDTANIKVEVNFSSFLADDVYSGSVNFPLYEEDFTPYFDVNHGSVVNMRDRFCATLNIKYPFCWPEKKGPDLFFSLTQSPSKSILLKNYRTNKDTDLIGQPSDWAFKVSKEFKAMITFSTSRSSGKPATLIDELVFTVKSRPSKIRILGGGRFLSKKETLNLTAFIDNPDGADDGSMLWECFKTLQFENAEENRCMLNDEVPLAIGSSKQTTFKFEGQMPNLAYFRFTQRRKDFVAQEYVQVRYHLKYISIPTAYACAHKPEFYPDEDIIFHPEIVGTFYATIFIELKECIHNLDSVLERNILPSDYTKWNTTYTSKFPNTIMLARKFNAILPKGIFPIGFHVKCIFSFQVTDLTNGNVEYLEPVTEYIKIIPRKIHPYITVYPSEGYAWESKFILRAHGWTSKEEELPLLFRFGYIDKQDTNRKVYIGGWSAVNYIVDTRLAVFSNDTLESDVMVFVEVKNQDKYVAVAETNVKLLVNSSMPPIYKAIEDEYVYYEKIDIFRLSYIVYLLRSLELRYSYNIDNSMSKWFKTFVTEFLAANIYSDTGRQMFDVIHYLTMTYVETNETNPLLEDVATVLNDLAKPDVLKYWERDFDYFQLLTQILEWMNKVIDNSANYDKIFQAIKNFLSFFPQKVCSSLEMGHTKHFLTPYISSFKYINVNIYREKFTDDLNVGNTIFQRENIAKTDDSDTVSVEMTEDTTSDQIHKLEKKWGTWGCSPYFPHGCNGFCFSEVRYDRNVSKTVEENLNSDFDLITDMFELGLYNPEAVKYSENRYDDMQPSFAMGRSRQDDYIYRMIIPVKEKNITHNDHMRCHTVNLKTNRIEGGGSCRVREQLILDDPSKGNESSFSIDCNCKKLGRVVGIRDIVPTEKPTLSDSLNISLYFWGKRDRCEDTKKRESLLGKLKPELAKRLGIQLSRIRYIRCTYDNKQYIMMYIRIKDVMGEKRVYDIETEVQSMIVNHWTKKLRFEFDDGRKDEVEMYNIDNTTPKPPPSPLPPFTDVTTHWLPIFLGIFSIVGIFLSCVIMIFCIHTRNLKEEVYTDINSDRPPEKMSEEERIRQMNKRAKEQKLNEITNHAINMEMKGKTSNKRVKIGPIGDSNAIATAVYAPSDPVYVDTVDEPHQFFALDDSDDEQSTSDVGSRNYGFEIESNSIRSSATDLPGSSLDHPTGSSSDRPVSSSLDRPGSSANKPTTSSSKSNINVRNSEPHQTSTQDDSLNSDVTAKDDNSGLQSEIRQEAKLEADTQDESRDTKPNSDNIARDRGNVEPDHAAGSTGEETNAEIGQSLV